MNYDKIKKDFDQNFKNLNINNFNLDQLLQVSYDVNTLLNILKKEKQTIIRDYNLIEILKQENKSLYQPLSSEEKKLFKLSRKMYTDLNYFVNLSDNFYDKKFDYKFYLDDIDDDEFESNYKINLKDKHINLFFENYLNKNNIFSRTKNMIKNALLNNKLIKFNDFKNSQSTDFNKHNYVYNNIYKKYENNNSVNLNIYSILTSSDPYFTENISEEISNLKGFQIISIYNELIEDFDIFLNRCYKLISVFLNNNPNIDNIINDFRFNWDMFNKHGDNYHISKLIRDKRKENLEKMKVFKNISKLPEHLDEHIYEFIKRFGKKSKRKVNKKRSLKKKKQNK